MLSISNKNKKINKTCKIVLYLYYFWESLRTKKQDIKFVISKGTSRMFKYFRKEHSFVNTVM